MFVVDTAVEIERPAPEVFDFVADMTHAPLWQSGLHLVERIPPGPVRVGSEHVFERRFAGRTLKSRNRITELQPPTRIAFEIPEGLDQRQCRLRGDPDRRWEPSRLPDGVSSPGPWSTGGTAARPRATPREPPRRSAAEGGAGGPARDDESPDPRGHIAVSSARAAAIVTWVYALGFGLPAVPVSIYLMRNGQLPSFFGLFEMYGGPWSASVSDSTFVGLLLLFGAVTLVAAWSAWLLWQRRRIGAVLNLGALPVEAVFWIGFALPLPWLTGLARVVLVALAWNSLSKPARQAELAP